MSGKKKSGFQITSVTSDYEQQQQQQRREQQGLVLGRPPTPGHAEPPCSSPRGAPGEEEAAAEEEEEGGKLPNGPPQGGLLLGPGPAAVGGASSSSAASRFRVVKLDQSSGEPYKRGRWTCRDSYHEAEAATEQAAAHLLAGRLGLADQCLARHPHSLDSRLEVAGLLLRPKLPAAAAAAAAAAGPFSPQPPRRGTAAPPHGPLLLLPPPGPPAGHHQARSLGGGGGGGGLPGLLRPHQTPPSAGAPRSPRAAPSGRGGDPPVLVVEEAPPGPGGLPKGGVAQREAPAAEEPRHKVFSASSSSSSSPRLQPRSRPSSPAAPLFREDASPSRKTSDPFGAARLSLAQSMFGMGVGGGAHDCDEDSGTNSSMIAIDNKIEQAMDLVKSHLMFAVREEVEVLREQIKELSERNALLEQENALLRSLANADQLSCFQAQLHTAKPSSSGSSD